MGIVCPRLPVQIGLRILQFKKQDHHPQNGGKTHQQQIGIQELDRRRHNPDTHPHNNGPSSFGVHLLSLQHNLRKSHQHKEKRENISCRTAGPICINYIPFQIIMNGQAVDQHCACQHTDGIDSVLPPLFLFCLLYIKKGIDQPEISHPDQRDNIGLTDQRQQKPRKESLMIDRNHGQDIHEQTKGIHRHCYQK